jgi:superfamily II DNA/RNA helicase
MPAPIDKLDATADPLLPAPLLEALARRFSTPSPLQSAYWSRCLAPPPPARGRCRSRRHAVLTAPTGSGKTVCFLVPAIAALLAEAEDSGGLVNQDPHSLLPAALPGQPRIVVVAPTRELAVQVHREALELTAPATSAPCDGVHDGLGEVGTPASREPGREPGRELLQPPLREGWLSAACLYGGVPPYHQVRLLEKGVHLLAATPGRLQDLLGQGRLRLDATSTLVLDEYDRLLSGPLRSQVEP